MSPSPSPTWLVLVAVVGGACVAGCGRDPGPDSPVEPPRTRLDEPVPAAPAPPAPDTARGSPFVAVRPGDCSVPPPMEGMPTAYARRFSEEDGFGRGSSTLFRMGDLVYVGFAPPRPRGVRHVTYSVQLWALDEGCGLWVRRAETRTRGRREPAEWGPTEFLLLRPQPPHGHYRLPDAHGDPALTLIPIDSVVVQVGTEKAVEVISED